MHQELQTLLRNRLDVISDHAFRDREPAAHLEALKNVSERIDEYSKVHNSRCDAKLRHYLANHSYQKALDHITT